MRREGVAEGGDTERGRNVMDRRGCRFLINFGQDRKFSLCQTGLREKPE